VTRRLLLSVSPGEIWAAVTADDELAALRLVRDLGAAGAGDVYRGRVVALRPAIPAVLVDIGEARPGFLGGEDMPPGIKPREGEAVIVRVTKAARADKAASLSMKFNADAPAFAATGPAPELLHRRDTPLGALLRDFGDADAVVVDDPAALAEIRRVRPDAVLHADAAPLFEAEGVAASVEAAMAPRVALPKDGAIGIDVTAAATVIDVDGGKSGAIAANFGAAREIARQIRLRDLSGPIVIDFVGMRDRGQRARVEAALKQALGDEPDYLGWTRLGHYELVVKRRRPSLTEQLFAYRPGAAAVKTALTIALEALRALSRESRAAPGKQFRLEVHPDVAACVEDEARPARQELERRLGYAVRIAARPRPRDSFAVVPIFSS
jgi:Ribonuclease G/E